MKNNPLYILLILLITSACSSNQNNQIFKQGEIFAIQTIRLHNPLNQDRMLVPVEINLSDLKEDMQLDAKTRLLISQNNQIIPSQLDDLNNDGKLDQLVCQVQIGAKSDLELKIFKISKSLADGYQFQKGIYAQMGMKNGMKPFIKKDSIYSESGDLYKQIMHHGPASESKMMAYRMYFDDRCSIDIYGKMHKRLELETTNWYSNDSLVKKQYGGDILFVKNTLGVGSPRIWNGKETQLLKANNGRYSVIRAKGPLRTIIDMVAPNIESYAGNSKVLLRMIQYAGKREMILQIYTDNDLPQFCTGIRKMDVSEVIKDEENSYFGLWGTEFPRLNHEKYPKVTVGLGVIIPQQYFEVFDQDEENHLVRLKGNKTFVEYVVTAAFQEEKEGIKSADSFFNYLNNLSVELNNPVSLIGYK